MTPEGKKLVEQIFHDEGLPAQITTKIALESDVHYVDIRVPQRVSVASVLNSLYAQEIMLPSEEYSRAYPRLNHPQPKPLLKLLGISHQYDNHPSDTATVLTLEDVASD